MKQTSTVMDTKNEGNSRKYCAWSAEERDLVCQALLTCAKNRIENTSAPAPLRKKRQVDLDYIATVLSDKTSTQIRDYYYRSLKQIDKLLKERSYEFETSNADDARAALIFFHKLQTCVFDDLSVTSKDKAQRKTANSYISERLVAALERFKADPVKGILEWDVDQVNAVSDSALASASASASQSAAADFESATIQAPTDIDNLDLSWSPKATKLPYSDDEHIFLNMKTPPAKRQRKSINTGGFGGVSDLNETTNEKNQDTSSSFYNDEDVVDEISIMDDSIAFVSRALWPEDDLGVEAVEKIILGVGDHSFQEKLSLWVADHDDVNVVRSMDDFLHSMFD